MTRPTAVTAFGVESRLINASEGWCSRGVTRYSAEIWKSQKDERYADQEVTYGVLKFIDGKHIQTVIPDRQTLSRCEELMLRFTGETDA